MLDSEVRLGRAVSIPKPGVTESLCSGRISPKRSPFWRGTDFELGGSTPAPEASCVMDLDVGTCAELAVRGLDILLANDCELFGVWLRVLRTAELFVASRPVSRAAVVLGEPYELVLPPAAGDLPPTVDEAGSRLDARETVFRAEDDD